MKKYIILLPLFIWSCASQKKQDILLPLEAPAVQWESKAQLRDFKANKTNNLNIDIIAIKNSQLRMEISASLGYPVASYVSTPSDLKMAIYTQKKYYFGRGSGAALKHVFNWPLDPSIFHNIIFDIPIKGWDCENNSMGLVSLCKKKLKKGELVVTWPDRKEGSKRVIIQAPQFEMQWLFNSYSVLKQIKPNTFTLEAPSGYKVIRL